MRKLSAVLVALVVTAGAVIAWPSINALAFIARAADMSGAAHSLAEWRAQPFVIEEIRHVPTRHGAVPTRLYRPTASSDRRPVTLVPGVHMDGINETRLMGMAQDLAASGFTVLTLASPDLQRFRITPASTDIIEDVARWLAAGADGTVRVPSDGKIGMLGISFSGGLSIVAAGRSTLRDHVSYVLSFGGHGDLQRVMRYLCSGNAPALPALTEDRRAVVGAEHVSIAPPHDYGVAVTLLSLTPSLVPAAQVEPLREAILTFLSASSLDMVDKPRAAEQFARARAVGSELPEPARTLMGHVNARAVDELGRVLLPVVETLSSRDEHRALSPERATAPAARVYLLHGAEDNVIPTVETVLLATHLRPHTEVRALLSGLITHAEVDRSAAAVEVWRLGSFWRDLMTQ